MWAGRHHDLRVVVKVPDAHVAQLAEQPADLARHVVVVDVPAFTAATRQGGFADCTHVVRSDRRVNLGRVRGVY